MTKRGLFCMWLLFELHTGKTTTLKGTGTIPGILRIPGKADLDNYFSTLKLGPFDPKVHWCGIFQTYLLIKSGVDCSWNQAIVDNSGGRDLEIVTGKDAQVDLHIGDIVRVNHNQHHFAVVQPAKSGFLQNIEGNAGGIGNPLIAGNWAANMRHNVVEDICVRYRILT